MKKKILWLVVSCLMVLSLVLASCAPAAVVEEEEEVAPPTEAEVVGEAAVVVAVKEMVQDALGRLVEKPKYGGVFTTFATSSPTGWDGATRMGGGASRYVYDKVRQVDWTKGPSGSGEASFRYNNFPQVAHITGMVAESWEWVEEGEVTELIYHIRKGIHFHDKPPTNGRECDAYDVESTYRRWWQLGGKYTTQYPADIFLAGPVEESIEATDKWTVVVRAATAKAGQVWEKTTLYQVVVMARDACEEYGTFTDWRTIVGTGPFELVDFVPDVSETYVRNPNYWQDHPLFPGMQMPFIDGIKILVVADASTRMAGLRAGKLDWLGGTNTAAGALTWEDAASMIRTNPELKYIEFPQDTGFGLCFRTDKTELPFGDVRVRQALSMAIDYQEIIDTIMGGQGAVLSYPIAAVPDLAYLYVPLEDQPPEIAQYYTYHPDKAKELLAEAGYPDGFKTNVTCKSAEVDSLSIIKEYWAQVGVELSIVPKESAAHKSLQTKKTWDEILTVTAIASVNPLSFIRFRPGGAFNYSMIDDPVINAAMDDIDANYFDFDYKVERYKEIIPHVLTTLYHIKYPVEYLSTFWQPWVKHYSGENSVGYYDGGNFVRWIWIDQDLKEEMTGRR